MVLDDQLLILVPGSALIACLVFVLTITKVSQLQAVTVLSLVSAILAVLLQQPAETLGRMVAMAAVPPHIYAYLLSSAGLLQTDLPPHHAAERPVQLPSRLAPLPVPAPPSAEASRFETRRIIETFPPEMRNLTTADSAPCRDQREDCQLRAASGECSINDLRKADLKMHKHVAMLLLQCPGAVTEWLASECRLRPCECIRL